MSANDAVEGLPDTHVDQAVEMVKLLAAGKLASTPPEKRARLVLEMSSLMVASLTTTIEELRQENADLRAEMAQLRGN